AKVRILNEGDTIRASTLDPGRDGEDRRNASYIRYEQLVDKNARYRGRPVILEKKTFYGELQHILLVNLNPIPAATPPLLSPEMLLLAVIRNCSIESDVTAGYTLLQAIRPHRSCRSDHRSVHCWAHPRPWPIRNHRPQWHTVSCALHRR
ncbi:hypothetical protein BC628DRAFT_1429843, partial [Trametes gibbosa]